MPWSRSSPTVSGFQPPLYGAACLSRFECYHDEIIKRISVYHFDTVSWSFPLAQGLEIRQEYPRVFCGDGNQANDSQFRVAQADRNLWSGWSFPAVRPPILKSLALQDSKWLKEHTVGICHSHSVRNSNLEHHSLILRLLRWPWWMKLGWHRRLRKWGTRQEHLLSQASSAARFLHN